MNTRPAPPATIARPAATPTDEGVAKRWLRLARVVVVTVTALALVIAIVSVPLRFALLHTVCAADPCATGEFAGQKGQLGPAGVRTLRQQGLSLGVYAAYLTALDVARIAVGFAFAVAVLWRRPAERMALFLAIFFVSFGVSVPLDTLAASWPFWGWLATAQHTLGGTAMFTIFFYLFPDGRFVPRWTRWLAVAVLAWQIPPLVFPGSPLDPATWFPLAPVLAQMGWWFTGIGPQVYRYRRVSSPVQRQQTKWVVFGYVATMLGLAALAALVVLVPATRQPGSLPALGFQTMVNGILLIIPLSIVLAILRYRLWDIDILINRTLVYGALTACVVGLYTLLVGGLGALFQARGSLAVALAATGLVAVLFQPLRERLQRGVNRLLYGERDEPYAVLSRLGQRLEGTLAPDAVLPTITRTVTEALRLPYAAITLRQDGASVPVAATGMPVPDPVRLPLVYQQEQVGELLLAPRAPGEDFGPADRRLLDDLARQAGIAAHAVRLTADLQRSRERLVTAREEERRRLRRDLHDGLGPALGAQMLKLGSARVLYPHDPAAADALLEELERDMEAALADIRRLVYNLRPPALDDLGLVGAIRETAARYDQSAYGAGIAATPNGRLRVAVDAPERLPPLPAAVEVAAYRIAQEALTNVVRHAGARHCTIRVSLDDAPPALCLEITDDGVGVPETRTPGVGLTSMRERAEELGGSCAVESPPGGGTRVLARLPLGEGPGVGGQGSGIRDRASVP